MLEAGLTQCGICAQSSIVQQRDPSISVVTAVRNGREFLRDNIESVLSQTNARVEHVIVDGASTDGTVELIRSYANRLGAWVSEPDRGIADAFNKGIALARGDYLIFLNSDDYLAGPDVIAEVTKAAASAECPALVYGDCEVVTRESRTPLYRVSPQFSPRRFLWGISLPHPSLFFHRSYFDCHGNYDLTFKVAMDLELLARGVSHERMLHVPRIVSVMRDGGVSTRDRTLVVDETIRALRKNNLISPVWGEARLRAYYAARAVGRAGLSVLGLYQRWYRLRT